MSEYRNRIADALIRRKNIENTKNKLDTTKMKQPSFMMVLVGIGNIAYRREDGIYVVPIGCLKD